MDRTPPRPSLESLQEACVEWNKHYPIGTSVRVRLDDGRTKNTKTRGQAGVLGGHSAVILLEGFSGCYLLNRCTPMNAIAK